MSQKEENRTDGAGIPVEKKGREVTGERRVPRCCRRAPRAPSCTERGSRRSVLSGQRTLISPWVPVPYRTICRRQDRQLVSRGNPFPAAAGAACASSRPSRRPLAPFPPCPLLPTVSQAPRSALLAPVPSSTRNHHEPRICSCFALLPRPRRGGGPRLHALTHAGPQRFKPGTAQLSSQLLVSVRRTADLLQRSSRRRAS